MISSKELQNKYVDLYKMLRYYLWDMNYVETLAELEVTLYDSFPDIVKAKQLLHKLKGPILLTAQESEDEELKEAFESLESALEDSTDSYLELHQVKEVMK